jgi:predicted RNA-binding protein
VDELTSPAGIVALAGSLVALTALVIAVVLAVRLRRLRGAQRAVLGELGERDLVEHAVRLERGFLELRDWVEETATGVEARMVAAEAFIDGCIAHRALVRYDAYGELSGQQSSSIALLDARRSGVVLSSIAHRDSARMYVKQVVEGRAEHELSPEEQEAVAAALSGQPGAPKNW